LRQHPEELWGPWAPFRDNSVEIPARGSLVLISGDRGQLRPQRVWENLVVGLVLCHEEDGWRDRICVLLESGTLCWATWQSKDYTSINSIHDTVIFFPPDAKCET
jgi:hypothetical protein